ncbi:hypothetical protein CF68_22595 [Cupriavidus sp. SK-4]|nr:hypothetical protein CF68_22595 [Cupriavidus sp. SK-4]
MCDVESMRSREADCTLEIIYVVTNVFASTWESIVATSPTQPLKQSQEHEFIRIRKSKSGFFPGWRRGTPARLYIGLNVDSLYPYVVGEAVMYEAHEGLRQFEIVVANQFSIGDLRNCAWRFGWSDMPAAL